MARIVAGLVFLFCFCFCFSAQADLTVELKASGNTLKAGEVDFDTLLVGVESTRTLRLVNVDQESIQIRTSLGGPMCGQWPFSLPQETGEVNLFETQTRLDPGQSFDLDILALVRPGVVCFQGFFLEILVNVGWDPEEYEMTPPIWEVYDRGLNTIVDLRADIAWWDVSSDGLVDVIDLTLVAIHFGHQGDLPVISNGKVVRRYFSDHHPALRSDINLDGVVDIGDMVAVGQHFGESYDTPSVLAGPAGVSLDQVTNPQARAWINQFLGKQKPKKILATTWGARKGVR